MAQESQEWTGHERKDGAMFLRTLAIRSEFGEVDINSAREEYADHREGWEDIEPPFEVALEHGTSKRWLATTRHGGKEWIQPLTLD